MADWCAAVWLPDHEPFVRALGLRLAVRRRDGPGGLSAGPALEPGAALAECAGHSLAVDLGRLVAGDFARLRHARMHLGAELRAAAIDGRSVRLSPVPVVPAAGLLGRDPKSQLPTAADSDSGLVPRRVRHPVLHRVRPAGTEPELRKSGDRRLAGASGRRAAAAVGNVVVPAQLVVRRDSHGSEPAGLDRHAASGRVAGLRRVGHAVVLPDEPHQALDAIRRDCRVRAVRRSASRCAIPLPQHARRLDLDVGHPWPVHLTVRRRVGRFAHQRRGVTGRDRHLAQRLLGRDLGRSPLHGLAGPVWARLPLSALEAPSV